MSEINLLGFLNNNNNNASAGGTEMAQETVEKPAEIRFSLGKSTAETAPAASVSEKPAAEKPAEISFFAPKSAPADTASAPAASAAERPAAEKPAEISFFAPKSTSSASSAQSSTAAVSTASMTQTESDDEGEGKKEHIKTEAEMVRDNYMKNRARNRESRQQIRVVARSVEEYFDLLEL